ncbi:serine hydrolase domain-containing protein [Chitinophaga solisilvae]|uniref:serine hydrolase domain-containing protein n=1 Tax=Chitinophaga solisilvae TaxID=1233460 RepID=UPI00136ABF68|nr:serine hydrolase domain-containing protein [Chitinophaga solisilvae]
MKLLISLLLLSKLGTGTLPDTVAVPQVDKAVKTFMEKYNVPGVSVAVTRNGKLVYARGYGFADTAARQRVTPGSRFRIASVSKCITAVAILKLAEAGKLSADDKVFGAQALLGVRYGQLPYSGWLQEITVRQLLQHTAGAWPNNARDPMFLYPSLSADSLISRTLIEQPVLYQPGKVYAYSNFGYCLLGRIIEKVSGQSYETYVQSLLQEAGIHQMETGSNTLAERKPQEVVYYGQQQENPYIYNIARMDAHGGWIATATDLARFLTAVDGFPSRADLLSSASITQMTTPSAANPNYALGWLVNVYNNWWHAGSLPGTASEIVRAANGFTWVILCNTRTDKGFFNDLDGLMWQAVNNPQTRWPDTDLFQPVPVLTTH